MAKISEQKASKGLSTIPKSLNAITDPRFASISTDPRYRLPSTKHARVKLDKRFARMLHDDDFSKKASVDRYGRKLPKGSGRKELERFYRVEEGDDKEVDEADDDEEVRRELRKVETYDPARQGGFDTSEESSEEGDEEEVLVDAEEGPAELADVEAEEIPMGEVSSRIALVNLDWDNIGAVDLLAVAQSFVPPDGRIRKVSIYPSEFGKERMEREELEGPPPELFTDPNRGGRGDEDLSSAEDSSEDEDADKRIRQQLQAEDKGEEFSSSQLRAYQLSRLRYYYAVITCSSPSTAHALYTAMDGREYLSTANFFDMRFVPEDTSFDDDRPRDECEKVPEGYRPNEFVTDALTHSKVRLTWDADDQTRKEVQKRAFSRGELEENDLLAYVGSESSDDDEEPTVPTANGVSNGEISKTSQKEAQRQRMRAALGLSAERAPAKSQKSDAPVGDLQVTFTPALSSGRKGESVFANEPEETTVAKYVRKEKERKAKRKAKAKASREGEGTDGAPQQEQATAQPNEAPAVSAPDRKRAETAADHQVDDATQDPDPFADAFFTDPVAANAKSRSLARAQKRKDRSAAAAAAAPQRAELELLMADDQGAPSSVRHFDMKEVVNEEKAARKKGRGRGGGKKAARGEGDADGDGGGRAGEKEFEMDVGDPRFASVFAQHEFAIDPTNPRFKGTEGMRALLEEGRRRRKRGGSGGDVGEGEGEGEGGDAVRGGKAKRRKVDGGGVAEGGGDELQALVAKVKGRSGKKSDRL